MNRRVSTAGARSLQTQCIQVIHVENQSECEPAMETYEAEFSPCFFATGAHIQKGQYRFVVIKSENPYKLYFEWFKSNATGAAVYDFMDTIFEERAEWKWWKEEAKKEDAKKERQPGESTKIDAFPNISAEKRAAIRDRVTRYVLETMTDPPVTLTLSKRLDDKLWHGTTRILLRVRPAERKERE